MVCVNIVKLSQEAKIPEYAKSGDAGMDLVAISKEYTGSETGRPLLVYGTGLAVQIPEGYVGLIFPRSSIASTDLRLTNSVGVIDSGYRGEIKFKFELAAGARPTKQSTYEVGDRIGQLVILPYPRINWAECCHLAESERGDGGFGSTGR